MLDFQNLLNINFIRVLTTFILTVLEISPSITDDYAKLFRSSTVRRLR